jgi:hypothetical protein
MTPDDLIWIRKLLAEKLMDPELEPGLGYDGERCCEITEASGHLYGSQPVWKSYIG